MTEFPAYTAELVMEMPFERFTALYSQIEKMRSERDIRLLHISATAAHPGKKGEALKKLDESLRRRSVNVTTPASTVIPNVTPLTGYEEQPGEIAEIRRRQMESHERIERERKQNAGRK